MKNEFVFDEDLFEDEYDVEFEEIALMIREIEKKFSMDKIKSVVESMEAM